MLDNLSISFSEVDTNHERIVEENKKLKKDLTAMKALLENSVCE
jgi:hypothetical protein